jgi:tetratricopeptide (TPR) repeat protein
MRRGAADQAIPLLERGMKLCETYHLDVQVPWNASTLGLAYAFAGRHKEGIEHAQEAVRRGDGLALTRYQPLRVSMLAQAYLLAGDCENARANAQQALELARRYRERGPEAWTLLFLAGCEELSGLGATESARQGYLTALHHSAELGMRPLVAHCHLGLGRVYAGVGDREQAQTYLASALSMYREMEMHHWPEQAESALQDL